MSQNGQQSQRHAADWHLGSRSPQAAPLPAFVFQHAKTSINSSLWWPGRILDDRTIELTFPHNPDGKYLLEGGTRAGWEAFGLPTKWRNRLAEGVVSTRSHPPCWQ
jgi:hypothetical protein